jgi:hypothetical protein
MPFTGCYQFMDFVTTLVARREDNPALDEVRRIASIGAPVDEVEEWIRTFARRGDVDLMLEELYSLPPKFIKSMLTAWEMADEAGLPFTAQSIAPADLGEGLSLARAKRVEMAITVDEGGVTFGLKHVPGYHAGRPVETELASATA